MSADHIRQYRFRPLPKPDEPTEESPMAWCVLYLMSQMLLIMALAMGLR